MGKHILRYVTESTMWILVALGLCELILQTTLSRLPEMNYEKDWGAVPILGSVRFWGTEGYGTTHYLAHGEIATPFDDGAISVVVLGDSHTEALHVSDGAKFVSLAETSIRSRGKAVNLHNLGMSGNNIADYIYFAPIIKQYYNPKIIVIQLAPNDGKDGFNLEHRNYFIPNSIGNLELRHKDQYFNKLYNKLRIVAYSLGRNRYSQMVEKTTIEWNSGEQFQPVQADGTAARMEDQLKLLKEAYSGIKVILLLLPYTPNINENNLNFANSEYQKLIENAEKTGDFYIIDPQPEFDHLIEQGRLPRGFVNSLPGQGHMNKFGHIIIGELLAEKILEIIQ